MFAVVLFCQGHSGAHRTQRADFPHCALGQDFTPSSTARRVQAAVQRVWDVVFYGQNKESTSHVERKRQNPNCREFPSILQVQVTWRELVQTVMSKSWKRSGLFYRWQMKHASLRRLHLYCRSSRSIDGGDLERSPLSKTTSPT